MQAYYLPFGYNLASTMRTNWSSRLLSVIFDNSFSALINRFLKKFCLTKYLNAFLIIVIVYKVLHLHTNTF